jgi:2-polyprenyl-3-methyl-5-hydroxy-6-metoxy-1,4-benzoquinol methylase
MKSLTRIVKSSAQWSESPDGSQVPGANLQLRVGIDWKQRLYDRYVSSGQAFLGSRPETQADIAKFSGPAHFVLRHLPANPDTRIVDLGCGYGKLLWHLSRAGYRNLAGVDSSPEQIDLAHRMGITGARIGRIDEFLGGIASDSLDVVTIMDVLEHLTPQELMDLLDEIARVLRPGGVCLAHVPNGEGLYGMRVRYGDITHEQAFTPRSMSQVFSAVGMSDVKCYEDKPVIHGPISLARRILWDAGTLPHRLLLASETGLWRGMVLTQNMFVRARA